MTRLHRKIRMLTEKAILEYGMIRPGDRILIGVSGGPDSLSLLKIFTDGFVQVQAPFTFLAAHVDPGFQESGVPNRDRLSAHFGRSGIESRIVPTEIGRLALDPDAKKNPCFICAHHRRREMYRIAHREACTRIAYAHHKDDIIETLLINILYGREIGSMNPVQPVFRGSMHIIRPFMYVDESMLKDFARESGLPDLPRLCPMDGRTRRQRVKELIAELQKKEKNANIRENIFKSQYRVNIDFSPESLRIREGHDR
ncbi:MAG TPA: hypothetical protein ENN17_08105 [bacterium]|nr:hypothetical protein [bacterium]